MNRLLDLYCGGGGASMGYYLAGFDVTGVDHLPQPNYPFEFHQMKVEDINPEWARSFDVIHASPPCQAFTAYKRRTNWVCTSENLIPATREALRRYGRPYIIENIPGAPLTRPVTLCGSMFGLDVRRHRLFETSFHLPHPSCHHERQTPRFPCAGNRTNPRSTVEIGVWRIPWRIQSDAIGIDWMTVPELSQAIPPEYTKWIGRKMYDHC